MLQPTQMLSLLTLFLRTVPVFQQHGHSYLVLTSNPDYCGWLIKEWNLRPSLKSLEWKQIVQTVWLSFSATQTGKKKQLICSKKQSRCVEESRDKKKKRLQSSSILLIWPSYILTLRPKRYNCGHNKLPPLLKLS